MFSRVKNFVCRHRKKFIVSGVIVGGSILLSRYAHKKFIEWQDKETKDFLDRTRKQYQFENTERTCNQTILSLANQLKNEISKILDSETLLAKLRSINDKEEKIAVWEELKITSIARHAAFLYCGLMLSIVIRIQLNIMAGIIARDVHNKTDLAVQESYLSLCEHFIHSGCKDICKMIKEHVKTLCSNISLKSKMTLNDIEHLFWSIQANISESDEDPLRNLPKYIFTEFNENDFGDVSNDVKNLYTHTVKILEKEEVSTMAESCVGRAFTNSIDSLAEYFVDQPSGNHMGESSNGSANGSIKNAHFINPTNVHIPVAKIIPIIHGLAKSHNKSGDADSWIYQYLIMDKLCHLGEDVFNSFANVRS